MQDQHGGVSDSAGPPTAARKALAAAQENIRKGKHSRLPFAPMHLPTANEEPSAPTRIEPTTNDPSPAAAAPPTSNDPPPATATRGQLLVPC